ncbi:uncharacterized protein Z520_00801 [Fonsecaea multimorphosa CBS 102226]|uniref:Uncharacterized protein n=1 Tax=Fonsecaea multimorphosa CBS 102226 TaxID=1442371 RepID=A0A0D2L4W0_9EURO|nr:uncharacterized protein Z520_00801 [Fonsecaea multimorphosa CBS 102226]KIY04109.1 hypothetical protein Z520_00801 [Fonsecaea multimorphosa CBS 102226]
MTKSDREPIAVVGIGCRFPGGITTTKDFWEILRRGIDTLSEVPPDRFDFNAFHDADTRKYGTIRNCKGGFVNDVHAFDAGFFGYYPAEASRIDPQQRLVLEASFHALEDSGTTLEQVAGSQTSVFLGAFMYDHLCIQTAMEQRDNVSPHVAMGVSNSSIANRVSHRLNLHGPSVTLDTACSSSLVALHLACQSLWAHESEAALAGGVNAILRPESTILMSKAGFLSPDGSCKSFDAAANGYVRSEGVGIVYLKPLSRALQNRDRIYALIRGSLVNQDGYTAEGFTVPSLKAQAALLQSVYSRSGIDPAKVRYVEAHGPGTPVGDPIEAKALGKQLGQVRSKDDESLWIGSVKGNFGHLEGASGITGFIKAALVTFHGEIPPQANHRNPNPSIDFQSLRLAIPTKTVPVTRDQKHKLWVGINSFGAGGTNAHAVLEEAPDAEASSTSSHGPRVFVLSAKSLPALEHAARDLASHLRQQQPVLDDVAYTLNMRRSRHSEISVIPAKELEGLCHRLDQLGSSKASKDILTLQKRSGSSPKVAFVFSGQGGQWLGMGAALADQEPVFRDSLAAFDDIFMAQAGFSIRAEISSRGDPSRLNSTVIVQPAIAAIQIALARLLISYGVKPGAIVGHSIGEVAAAHIAGALSLEQAVTVIRLRSNIQSQAAGEGSMLATGMSSTEAEHLILRRQLGGSVEVAALNGPKMTTLAGDAAELEQLAKELEARGTFARFVKVEIPYHSRFMDPFEKPLIEALSAIQGIKTDVSLYSTVTTSIEPGTHLTGEYWFKNVRKPVRYVETATKMLGDGCNFFVEIGPHPVLVSGTRGIVESTGLHAHVLPAMVRGSDIEPVSCLIGAAHAVGIDADMQSFNGGGGRFVDLPLYPFQREHYWFEHPEAQQRRLGKSKHPFLGDGTNLTDDGRSILRLRLSTGVSPFLADHLVDGALVFPVTGHIEAAYLAARDQMAHMGVWLEDLRFEHPVVLTSAEDFAPQVLLEIVSPAKDYVISTRPANSTPETAWQICSRGRINAFDQRFATTAEALDSVRARVRAGREVDVEDFYWRIEQSGLRYGEAFRGVQNLWQLGGEIFAYVKMPSSLHGEASRFRFHPALLDACIHTMFAELHHHGDSRYVYLPYHMERVQIFEADGATSAFVHLQVKYSGDTFFRCNASVYGENGKVLAMIVGLTAKRLLGTYLTRQVDYQICYQSESQEGSSKLAVDFTNILVLDQQLGDINWSSVMQRTFPRAQIHQRALKSVKRHWKTTEWGFQLDRRTLLIVPALLPLRGDLHEPLGAVIRALLHVAVWIREQQGTPTVVVITRGGCMTPTDTQCNPISSSVEAAARVMANELPQSRIRVVDIPLDQTTGCIPGLQDELQYIRLDQHDTVVAIRPEGRFVRRVIALDTKEEEKSMEKKLPARGGRYFCEADPNSSLDSIIIRQQPPTNLGPDEVAIDVHSAGLNFKDIMNALGLLSERATSGGLSGQKLGLEVAGQVVKIGENVRGIDVGAPVMARVSNGLGGFATANRNLVVPIPPSMTFTQAACLPVTYMTAYYALTYLGRLASGESVLIHAAAGGVGIAAIQIAKLLGARVFATAGSPARRAWVSEMGVEAVFDSRSLSFHDEVKKATRGLGVDVVLNSLTGSMFSQSVACLAPFGRFLEIGKTDIYRNMRLGLEQFGENCSFFAIDIDRLAMQKPELHRRMLDEVCALFESGKLVPPPVTAYPITQLSTALKSLSRSAVVGKVAVEMPENTFVDAAPPSELKLRPDRSYLITGGASGLGLQLARFLVERGAKHLVLVSRSGPKSADDNALLLDMRRRGVAVKIERADITNAEVVTAILRQQKPPIAGIVHSAAVLRDSYTHETTMDDFWAVFGPKAIGAWNMHLATQGMSLDFFVLISSMSSVLGLTGQFSYATANQFLDGLARHRRASGLPALSLNLGLLWHYAGMSRKSTTNDRVLEILESHGFSPMSLPIVLSAFERAILHGSTQRLAAIVDWVMFLKAYPHLSRDGAFLGLKNKQERMDGPGSHGSLSSLSGPGRIKVMAETLRSALAKIVGVEPSRISLTEKIDQYAFDSLTLTQLRSVILREFRITYPVMRLFQGPSLQEIALELESSFGNSSGEGQDLMDVANHEAEPMLSTELSVASPWFIRRKSANGFHQRVVCFHSMGTGASLFTPFLMDPPDGLDAIAVQLPGRETRADEAILTNMSEIVAGILGEMETTVGVPHVFWGHSFGGIIAFEVLKALRRQGKPLPRLLVTGTIAPHLVRLWKKRDVLLRILAEDYSPDYLLAVSRYVDNADFVRSILPLMRRDTPLLLGYQFDEEEILDVPITAFAARQDDMVYPDEVAAWRTYTKEFKLVEVDGDHWFLHRNRKLVLETLAALAR